MSSKVMQPFKKPRRTTQTKITGFKFQPIGRPAVKGELKEITNTTPNCINLAATSTANLINGVATGVTATTRVGRRINMTSLLVRANFAITSTTTGNSPLRVAIVYDSQTNAAAPAILDVWSVDSIAAVPNLDNSRRFKILIDEQVDCLGAAGPGAACFTRYVKMNLPVKFNTAGTAVVGAITTGSMYMYCWSSGNLAVAAPFSTITTRVRFTDA